MYNYERTEFIHVPDRLSGDIVIPYGITDIRSNMFLRRFAITSIRIPASVRYIEPGAFYNLRNLNSVTFEDNSRLESIGHSAFVGTSITEIRIPSGVTHIGNWAFAATPLSEINFNLTFAGQSRLEVIGDSAFAGTAITHIVIPHSVIHIGNWAFAGTNLQTVLIVRRYPEGTIDLGAYAFDDAPNLSIRLPDVATLYAYQNAHNWSRYATRMEVSN